MVLDKITKGYGDKVVLDNFSCKFDDKKITIIMGESGVGKTTLLNVIAGLTDYSGKLECCKNVSYLFHNDRLIPNLTVEENLKLIVNDINVDNELEGVELLNAKKKG
jgi:NitT/TauT family transport system ATP-binding protein